MSWNTLFPPTIHPEFIAEHRMDAPKAMRRRLGALTRIVVGLPMRRFQVARSMHEYGKTEVERTTAQ